MKYAVALVALAFVVATNLPRGHESALDGAAAYERLRTLEGRSNDQRSRQVEEWLRGEGLEVEFQPVESQRVLAQRSRAGNLIVTLGDGPTDIVIGAHMDAAHTGGEIVGGLVDNGAAVVVLARLAGDLDVDALRHRVRIVFFDAEEIDRSGSRTYAARFGERTAGVLNVDVIGLGDTAIYGPTGVSRNAVLGDAIRRMCDAGGHSCMNFAALPPSDYASFEETSVPALSIGMLPRIEAHQFWLTMHGRRGSGTAAGPGPRTFGVINTRDDRLGEVDVAAMEAAYCLLSDLVFALDSVLP